MQVEWVTRTEEMAGMGNGYADRIYVVIAWKDGQSEFWAAATKALTEKMNFPYRVIIAQKTTELN